MGSGLAVGVGEGVGVGLGAGATVTVRVNEVVRVMLPAVPVTVITASPAGVEAEVVMVSVFVQLGVQEG